MNMIRFYNTRGGHGVSTVAAAAALEYSTGRKTLLVEIGEYATQDAILGTPSIGHRAITRVNEYLDLVWCRTNPDTASIPFDAYDVVIVDGGNHLHDAVNYLVTKACYVSLRQSTRESKPQGVVFVSEEGRALTKNDVTSVLGAPIVATVPRDPHLARAIDAGLLQSRARSLESLEDLQRFISVSEMAI